MESAALEALSIYDTGEAYRWAKRQETGAQDPLTVSICNVLAQKEDPADFPYIAMNFDKHGSFGKFSFIEAYFHMLETVITDDQTVRSSLGKVKAFAEDIGPHYGAYVISMLDDFADERQARAAAAGTLLKAGLEKQAGYARQLADDLREASR